MSRGTDEHKIDELERCCPLVKLDALARHESWKLVGRVAGEVRIQVERKQLDAACKAFKELYMTARAANLLQQPKKENRESA